VRNLPTSKADPDGHCCWDEIKSFLVGAAKELHNWGADQAAHGIPVLPRVGGLDGRLPLAPAVGESTGLTGMGTDRGAEPVIESPSNKMETAGMVTMKVAPLVLAVVGAKAGVGEEPVGGLGRAAAKEGASVPESIPAGPGARPSPSQQSAINQMGDAHGCSTCGTNTPGTKSGNWVGDHQPPTALNSNGGPQVYKPQCLQCSRQQGGQVSAAVRASKKQQQTQ
jgi:hypothetical protein